MIKSLALAAFGLSMMAGTAHASPPQPEPGTIDILTTDEGSEVFTGYCDTKTLERWVGDMEFHSRLVEIMQGTPGVWIEFDRNNNVAIYCWIESPGNI